MSHSRKKSDSTHSTESGLPKPSNVDGQKEKVNQPNMSKSNKDKEHHNKNKNKHSKKEKLVVEETLEPPKRKVKIKKKKPISIILDETESTLNKQGAKNAFVYLLTACVKHEFDKVQVSHEGQQSPHKLVSTLILKTIGDEMMNALSQIILSPTQDAIVLAVMNDLCKHRLLPGRIQQSVGTITDKSIFDFNSINKKSVTGFCGIYFKALKLDEIITTKSPCDNMHYGKLIEREKKSQLAFYKLIANLAMTPSQADGLISELKDKQALSLNVLRNTHGFFADNKQKDTNRYKKYALEVKRNVW